MKMNFPNMTSKSLFRNYRNKNTQNDTRSLLQHDCGFPQMKPEQMGHGGLMSHLKFLLHFRLIGGKWNIEKKKKVNNDFVSRALFFFSCFNGAIGKGRRREAGRVRPNKHDASLDKPQTLNGTSQPAAQKATAGTHHNNLLSGET